MSSVSEPNKLDASLADLERSRVKLERYRLDLERQCLEMRREVFEESRKAQRRRFIPQEHLGTFIAAVVALATVIVSLTQIWVANISKSTELEITRQQQEREWRYKGLEFITKNADTFFGEDKERREHLSNALAVAFPPDIAGALLRNLKDTADTMEARNTFALTEDKMHGKNLLNTRK